VAEEAVAAKAAEEAVAVVAAKQVVEAKATKEAVVVKVGEEATTITGPDGSNGGGPSVAHTDGREAPDVTPHPKALGKRPVAMIGSGGSSPPPPTSTSGFTAPRGMPHIFCRFFSFFSPFFVQVF
jgi:hypothetical protein